MPRPHRSRKNILVLCGSPWTAIRCGASDSAVSMSSRWPYFADTFARELPEMRERFRPEALEGALLRASGVCRVRCRCPPKPGMAAAAATSCRSQLFAACEHRLPRSDHRSFDARRVPPEQISRKRLFSHVIASSRRHHANSCRKLIAIAKRWATRRELWGRLLGQDRRDQ